MDILLYKDGHLAVSESPLQGKENNLDDVVMLVTNPQDGDTLTYKNGKWVNGEGGGGSFAPDITNPQDGDTLVYNATAGKWVNGEGGSGGGMMLLTLTYTETSVTVDATYAEVKAAMQAGTLVGFYMPYDGANTLILALQYIEDVDPVHGNLYTVIFYNAMGGLDLSMSTDTEDGQLHAAIGGGDGN